MEWAAYLGIGALVGFAAGDRDHFKEWS